MQCVHRVRHHDDRTHLHSRVQLCAELTTVLRTFQSICLTILLDYTYECVGKNKILRNKRSARAGGVGMLLICVNYFFSISMCVYICTFIHFRIHMWYGLQHGEGLRPAGDLRASLSYFGGSQNVCVCMCECVFVCVSARDCV